MRDTNNKQTEKKKMEKTAWKYGKETADKSYEEIVYGDLVPSWIWDDVIWGDFFEIGRQGYDFPVIVRGWRYGAIPDCGRSYNYREQVYEHGISIMQVDGDERCTSSLAELRGSFDNRPKIKIEGYLNPAEVGGDGEPLVLLAKQL